MTCLPSQQSEVDLVLLHEPWRVKPCGYRHDCHDLGLQACYEAAGLPVLRLCLPPVAFTRVRATLQVDGQGLRP